MFYTFFFFFNFSPKFDAPPPPLAVGWSLKKNNVTYVKAEDEEEKKALIQGQDTTVKSVIEKAIATVGKKELKPFPP